MRRLAVLALIIVAASACARPTTPATAGKVERMPCPVPAEAETPAPNCVPIDPDANISANNAYRDYKTPAPSAQAAAEPVKTKLPSVLDSIRAHPPITEQTVSAALREAFPELSGIEVSTKAERIPGNAVGYGIFVGGACVHGWVGPDAQDVKVDGLSPDGGCLPLLGH